MQNKNNTLQIIVSPELKKLKLKVKIAVI